MKDEEKSREQLVQELVKMRKHSAKLQKEQLLLMNMMDNIPDALYFKDRKSRFVLANKSCARKHGFEYLEEMMGKTDFDFFSKEHAKQAYENEQEIIRTGKALTNIDEKETWPDGTVTWVSTTKMPLKDKGGKTIGTFGISRDITSRKALEEEREKLIKEIQETDQELRLRKEEMENDLNMAREVQMALLAQHYPKTFRGNAPRGQRALHFSHRYIATSELAGDFFEILPISDHDIGILIYDVMGHGVQASLLTAYLHGLVGELIPIATDTVAFMHKLNAGLRTIMQQFSSGMFATAFYLVADVNTGKVRYTNAGHPAPYILRRSKGTVEILKQNKKQCEPALGLTTSFKYTASQYSINNDDVILFFTDGLYEVMDAGGRLFGNKRLRNIIKSKLTKPPDQLMDEIIGEVNKYSGSKEFRDDVCMISMHVIKDFF